MRKPSCWSFSLFLLVSLLLVSNALSNDNKVAVTYYASGKLTLREGCLHPINLTYYIECNGNGIPQESQANLGLATCTTIPDGSVAADGVTTKPALACTEFASTASSSMISSSGVVFECVGSDSSTTMEDTADYDAIVTVLNDPNEHGYLDCTAPSFLGPYGGLVLQVALLCQDTIILSNTLRSAPMRGGCFGDPGDTNLQGGLDPAGTLACATSAIFNNDLTATLPRLLTAVSPTQTESMDNPQCVRRVPTNLSTFPVTNLGAMREALFEATLALSSGNPAALEPNDRCYLQSPAHYTATCGGTSVHGENDDGFIVQLDLENNQVLPDDAFGCTRVNDSTLTCPLDLTEVPEKELESFIFYFGCSGTTVQQLALAVEFVPEYMTCSPATLGVADTSSSQFYALQMKQICLGSGGSSLYNTPPYNWYADFAAQECWPATSRFDDSEEIRDPETGELIDAVVRKTCMVYAYNCFREPHMCRDGNIRDLGSLQARILPEKIFNSCLFDPSVTPPTPSNNNNSKSNEWSDTSNSSARMMWSSTWKGFDSDDW